MFARRHPLLFFLMTIAGCITLMVIVFFGFMSVMAGVLGSQIANVSSSGRGNIGIIEINGVIMSSKQVISEIQDFAKNKDIKAIILRIDSPGGGIGPAQEIYREVMKTKKTKKIITSMGSVAASGGFYIAAATDGIIANPGTITGSIGVIMEYANIMELAKKIGLSPVVIKGGEYKDMGSPLRELKDSEKKLLQDLVDELHQQFIRDAAKGRHMDYDTMAALSDGRVYTGQTALKLKLIDRLGNLDDAVQWAGELGRVKGELIPVYPKTDKMTFIRKFADTLIKKIDITGSVADHFRFVVN